MSPEQREPQEIREDIDETREELGDTVEALAGKADVKGQAKAKVDSAKFQAKAKVDSVQQSAQENPVPFAAAGAFAAGVVVGWILAR